MASRVWFVLCFVVIADVVSGRIPMRYYNSAEPDAPIYVPEAWSEKLSRQVSLQRLTAVRHVMADEGVDAYIIPTADAHNSQYIASADARREWVSGLHGSSGTAVVTANRALVWTDARYFTQFYLEVDVTLWALMRQGTDASVQQWLLDYLPPNSVVGIDPTTYTRSAWTPLENALRAANITLLPTFENLVDVARRNINDGPPSRPSNDLIPLEAEYTDTLNLRGSDIPFNPVFFSYLVLRNDAEAPENMVLFWKDGVLPSDVAAWVASESLVPLSVRPYHDVFTYLRNFTSSLPAGSSVWLSEDASHAIYLAVENDGHNEELNIISTVSPVALMKVYKNPVELQGFHNAHVKDGIAVVRSFHWLHKQIDAGGSVTEMQLSDQMALFRSEEEDAMGPSFATIAGAGEHGAIIHYRPSATGPQRIITRDDMVLVDSGGQYKDGTTDVTRTRHMSATPTAAQRLAFTRVMKGQINLGTAVFPAGTLGHVIEVLARKYLWDVGLDYGHGTGHGVGHYLNVHEGPTWILSGPMANDPGIRPDMIYSNEPGYYEVDEYGIRHEDLMQTIALTNSDHPMIKYLNDYHARVLATLGPILQDRGLTEEYSWLEKECAPIRRSAAILLKSSPVLAMVAILRLWVV